MASELRGIHLGGLHYVLWLEADERHLLRLNQAELAINLACTRQTLNRALASMEKDGRLRDVTGRASNTSKLFEIADPAGFDVNEINGPGPQPKPA